MRNSKKTAKEYFHDYYKKNKKKYLDRSKKWRQENKLRNRKLCREHVWKKHGWTPEMHKAALAAQKGVCAICKKRPTRKRLGRLFCDHNHKTKEARGLLCGRCNAGIGFLQDSSLVLKSAAAYLRKFGS